MNKIILVLLIFIICVSCTRITLRCDTVYYMSYQPQIMTLDYQRVSLDIDLRYQYLRELHISEEYASLSNALAIARITYYLDSIFSNKTVSSIYFSYPQLQKSIDVYSINQLISPYLIEITQLDLKAIIFPPLIENIIKTNLALQQEAEKIKWELQILTKRSEFEEVIPSQYTSISNDYFAFIDYLKKNDIYNISQLE